MKSKLRQYQRYPVAVTKEGRMSAAFLMGLMLGTFFFNIWGKAYMDELLLYKGLLTGRYEAGALAGVTLCLYIARKRAGRFLLLLFMELTQLCMAGRLLFCIYYGFCMGVCLSSFVLQYALKGILYFALFLFPHFIAYAMMWRVLNRTEGWKKSRNRLFAAAALFALGVLLEGYVHAGIMQKLLQEF